VVTPIVRLLRDPDHAYAAAQVLRGLGATAKSALRALDKAADNEKLPAGARVMARMAARMIRMETKAKRK